MAQKNFDPRDSVRMRMQLIGSIRRLPAHFASNPLHPKYDSSFMNAPSAKPLTRL